MNFKSMFLAVAFMSVGAFANTNAVKTPVAAKETTKVTAPSAPTSKQALSSHHGKQANAASVKHTKKN